MTSQTVEITCLECTATLLFGSKTAMCQNGHQYPFLLGRILDTTGQQSGGEAEAQLAQQMLHVYASASHGQLLVMLNGHHADAPDHLRDYYSAYANSAVERNMRMTSTFRAQAASWFDLSASDRALELGSGYGGNLLGLARLYGSVVGLEPSLPRLIVAAKLLDERAIANVLLVRGHARSLPFPDSTFDYITAINVVEHLADLDSVLRQVHRCLNPGGIFLADSRNRYDLFFREPHVKLRWVGFLPRSMAKRYVKWRTGLPYDNTRLLSLGDWRRVLGTPAWRYRFLLAKAQAYGYPAAADRILQKLALVAPLERLMLTVAPSHLIVAKK